MSLLVLLLLFFACSSLVGAQTLPACVPLVVDDANTGLQYTYDLTALRQLHQQNGTNYIHGTEVGQAWTIFVNVCGDASDVGCSSSTPGCQSDGSGKFFSIGTPQSFVLQPYYDPKDASKTIVPNGGVFVATAGGDICGNAVQRSMNLWFKCNPKITGAPSFSPTVTEQDPVSSKPTQCTYFFSVMEHSLFCPRVSSVSEPNGAGGAQLDSQVFLGNSLGDGRETLVSAIVYSTSLVTMQQQGFSCVLSAYYSCADPLYRCMVVPSSSTRPYFVGNFSYIAVVSSSGRSAIVATDPLGAPSSASCATNPNFLYTAGSAGVQWSASLSAAGGKKDVSSARGQLIVSYVASTVDYPDEPFVSFTFSVDVGRSCNQCKTQTSAGATRRRVAIKSK